MRILDVAQMTAADAKAREHGDNVELMRAAGKQIARAIAELAPKARRVIAFAGPGNNGGDAFAALAELDSMYDRRIYAMPAVAASEGRADAELRALTAGVRIVDRLPLTEEDAARLLDGADVVLDGLLGVGGRPEPAESMHGAIAAINASRAFVLALDVPTGVDAETGAVSRHAVRARATLAIGAVKVGLTLDPARGKVGALYLGDVGIAAECEAVAGPRIEMLATGEFLALLPHRAPTADKRTSGAPLVIAGSERYPGAAVLCARGAARAGAGYVTVAVPEAAAATVRAHLLEQVVVTYDPRDVASSVGVLQELVKHSGAVAIGPGLALDDATGAIVRGVLEPLTLPFVADASAFAHLAPALEALRGKRCVLTPHESEFARLSGGGEIAPGERPRRLRAFVSRTGTATLLKGRATLVDDGTTLHVNPTGTSALATAGTGDVLTGMIGTLLSQGLAPVDAARVAAYWHGLAGQAATRERRVGVTAGDLPDLLAAALPDRRASFGATSLLRFF